MYISSNDTVINIRRFIEPARWMYLFRFLLSDLINILCRLHQRHGHQRSLGVDLASLALTVVWRNDGRRTPLSAGGQDTVL